MRTDIKEAMKAEQECMNTCTAALQKLTKFYWTPTSGDSVAERQASTAVDRVLIYLLTFLFNQTFGRKDDC